MSNNNSLLNLYAEKGMSKKRVIEAVYLRIFNSLSDFGLSGKKYEKALKKISKQIAKEVIKMNWKNKDMNNPNQLEQDVEQVFQLKKEA